MANTMQVYAEYAFIENFCMDFSLLYCAKAATKNSCTYRRLALSASLGALFAIVFPLMKISGFWAIAVKIFSGAALCAVAGKYTRFSGYIKFAAVFAGATFLTGGALIAFFSLSGISYAGGSGYILSSVPVGIPLFCAVTLGIIIRKVAKKIYSSRRAGEFSCIVKMGGKQVECVGFYDSGNKVYYGGAPVSIIPRHVAEKIIDKDGIKTFVDIHTVAGKGSIPVFRADSLIIKEGQKQREIRGANLAIAPDRIRKIVLHSDISEVN